MSPRIKQGTPAGRLAKMRKVMQTIIKASLISNVDHVLRLILHSARETMSSEAVSLILVDSHRDVLYFHKIEGGSAKVKLLKIQAGRGIAGQVFRTGRPMIVNDTRNNRYFFPGVDKDTGFVSRQVLCVPLRSQRKIVGVLEAVNLTRGGGFNNEDLLLFTAFANQAAVAIENVRLTERACHDSLTKAYNREYFDLQLAAECERARRLKKPLSVLLIDVDRFKKVNDRWGHQAGDFVLASLAEVIRFCVRGSDVVARYGGDELALILTETPRNKGLIAAKRILQAVREHSFEYESIRLPVTVSIGLASRRRGLDHSAAELMRESDLALYRAKQGRNRVA